MARKAGQLISRGPHTWLVRVSLGRDPQSGTRKYHNKTVHGGLKGAQSYLNRRLQDRDVGRLPRAAAVQLDHYLDQGLATCRQAAFAAQELHRLRIVAAPICSRPATWVHRAVRHPGALCRDDRAGPVGDNCRIHERRTTIGLPVGGPLEDAGGRSLRWCRSASEGPKGNAGAQRRGVPAVPRWSASVRLVCAPCVGPHDWNAAE